MNLNNHSSSRLDTFGHWVIGSHLQVTNLTKSPQRCTCTITVIGIVVCLKLLDLQGDEKEFRGCWYVGVWYTPLCFLVLFFSPSPIELCPRKWLHGQVNAWCGKEEMEKLFPFRVFKPNLIMTPENVLNIKYMQHNYNDSWICYSNIRKVCLVSNRQYFSFK